MPLNRPGRIPLPLSEIVRAYEAGETAQTIATRYIVSEGTIRARLREAGCRLRAGHRPRTPRSVELAVLAALAQGQTIASTSRRFRLHRSTIAAIRKRNG